MGRVILVTGVSRYLGGRFAAALAADPAVDQVIGVDVIPPPQDLGGTRFVRADIRNPMIARIIEQTDVHTVVHLSVIATPVGVGGRISMKEINVIGTMQLLAACQRSPSLRRLVVKSTSAVYGSSPRDPSMFTEDTVAKVLPRAGWGKDSLEVEGYVRGFTRRRPDVEVATLRLANIVGPGIRTPTTDYFSMPVIPTVLGYDGRVQFVHEDDALEALRLATLGTSASNTSPGAINPATGGISKAAGASNTATGAINPATGAINIAGDGVLTLTQAARIAGRPTVAIPAPLFATVARLLPRSGMVDVSRDQVRFLSHGRGLDTTRMRTVLGLNPKYSTRQAFADFVASRGLHGPLSPEVIRGAERRVLDLLGMPGPRVG